MKPSQLLFSCIASVSAAIPLTSIAQNDHSLQALHGPTVHPYLTAEAARQMAQVAEHAAVQAGFAIVVSIMDNHGNLKYFNRMDNTSVGSIEVAQLKASTSAKFPVGSRQLAIRSAQLPGNPYASIPGMLLLEGGLPIINNAGQHIGSIGISGATPDLDARFAQTAIERYKTF